MRPLIVAGVLAAAAGCGGPADPPPPPNPVLAPNAPADRPVDLTGKAARDLDAAVAPYVAEARRTYPAAKARYLAGLPAGHHFFAVTKLTDGTGSIEVVFVSVAGIADGRIRGRIASDIRGVRGFKEGDPYTFPEADLVDWLIARPDGSEDGNVVGKFLDEYQKRR